MELNDSRNGIKLTINDISYRYPQEQKIALKNVTLSIKSGERVLITGKNDSGKSTLLYLVSGLLSPSNGSISIEDIPINNFNYNQLRSNIGGYLRDETLFEGSLLENITLGRNEATHEHVKWAIEAVGLMGLVTQLKDGYDTRIFPMGKQFSKSTVAKILIARAIVDKPRLLLQENSFSVFSTEDRKRLLNFLLSREHSWTVLLTSSQLLESNELIDRQIVLENGSIISSK